MGRGAVDLGLEHRAGDLNLEALPLVGQVMWSKARSMTALFGEVRVSFAPTTSQRKPMGRYMLPPRSSASCPRKVSSPLRSTRLRPAKKVTRLGA